MARYGVRFFVNGVARYVTVDNQLADGGTILNSGIYDLGQPRRSKPMPEVQTQGNITGNGNNYGNSFSTIGNGGAPERTLEEITGATAITGFERQRDRAGESLYNSSASPPRLFQTSSREDERGLSTLAIQTIC